MGAGLKSDGHLAHGLDFRLQVVPAVFFPQFFLNLQHSPACDAFRIGVGEAAGHGKSMFDQQGLLSFFYIFPAVRRLFHNHGGSVFREVLTERIVQKKFSSFKEHHGCSAHNDFCHGKQAAHCIGAKRNAFLYVCKTGIVFIDNFFAFGQSAAAARQTVFGIVLHQCI